MKTTFDAAWTHKEARVNGVQLHWVEEGEGPLILLLHGFPEFWYSWRFQIRALSEAGYRVIAPDMRGYNLSEKPQGLKPYRIEVLVEDVVALIRHAGETKATIVGHDWGGAIAWFVPMLAPAVVEKLVILNAPHPRAFQKALQGWAQLKRSFYIFLFQFVGLAERRLRSKDYNFLDILFSREPTRKDTITASDIAAFKEAMARPGALTAALSYYRASFWYPFFSVAAKAPPIQQPTLVLWGAKDAHLGLETCEGIEPWVQNLRRVILPNASHWIQQDAPEEVNRHLLEFLRA